MTERKPLGLSADQKQLREQRALALERLANPSPPTATEMALQALAARSAGSSTAPDTRPPRPPRDDRAPRFDRAERPERAERTDRSARSDRPERSDPRSAPRPPQAPRSNPRFEGGERFDSPVRDHRGARPFNEVARPAPAAAPFATPFAAPRTAAPSSEGAAQRVPASGARRVAAPADGPEGTRLNKRMAELRMCSRREGDAWIEQGWVTVNGVVAEMGQMVQATDRIEVNELAKGQQEQQVTILLHKPMGFVSGQAEDGHQPAVSIVNPRTRWQHCTSGTRFNFSQLQGLAPAGRLDIDSVGLLVLTQDGRVARQLIGEDSDMEKEYLVRVTCTGPDGQDITTQVQDVFPPEQMALLRHGLSLDGEPLKPAQVDWQNPEQLRFVLTQGKKRQIRRMCEQVGLKVVGLKRIRMGRITLGNLPAGQWRYLLPSESF